MALILRIGGLKMIRMSVITLAFTLIILSITNTALCANLVSHWPLDQNSGEEVKDVVGGHHGKIIGKAKWVKGQFGNGLQLTAPSNYVEVQKSKDLELSTLTLIVWVNFDSLAGRQEVVSYADSYGIFADGGIFRALLYNGNNWDVVNGTTKIEQGKWYQTALTVAKNGIAIYVNGKLDAQLATPAIAFQDFPMWFGGGPADNQFWLTGTIDEIELWNDVLPAGEIEKIYKNPPSLGAVDPNGKTTTLWGAIKR